MENEHTIEVNVMAKNPRPNAPEYTITTIKYLFDVVTPENIDRFLADFEAGLRACVHLKTLTKEPITMPEFIWIDDLPNEAKP